MTPDSIHAREAVRNREQAELRERERQGKPLMPRHVNAGTQPPTVDADGAGDASTGRVVGA
jgi:hypothetical protein